MLTKKITPVIPAQNHSSSNGRMPMLGTVVEYRFLGILIYKKTLVSPSNYGLNEFEYQTRI